MARDTDSPTTESPISLNAQDFGQSDDEILDNFADGPDDGVPMGLGGEKGKQAEPASSTLEADIVNGTAPPKQPGEENPPEETAGEDDPDQVPAGETPEETPPEETDSSEESEPEAPEIPPMLLQMAGYTDAAAAKADGLGTPEALNAFIRGRGQLLASQPGEPQSPSASTYGQPTTKQAPPSAESSTESETEFKPFELSEEETEVLDEQLQDTIRRMNEHNQRQFDSLRNSLQSREQKTAEQKAEEEVQQFDRAIQELGGEWQDVFGEGGYDELVRKGQTDPRARVAMEYRRDLFQAVQAIRDANAQRGFDPMDLQREIGFGLMQRFPDKFQKLISGDSKPAAPRRTSLNRPTQRRPSNKSADPLLSKLHKKYPNAGFTATGEDEFEGEI